jgi:hypothetical protein
MASDREPKISEERYAVCKESLKKPDRLGQMTGRYTRTRLPVGKIGIGRWKSMLSRVAGYVFSSLLP